MNAELDHLSHSINDWGVIDVKTDSCLFDQDPGNTSQWEIEKKPLLCVLCQLEFFTLPQYLQHHIQHVALPSVILKPVNLNLLDSWSAGKTLKKRPGPKSRTENGILSFQQQLQSQSPIKLTIKRLPTCQEPAFEVVNKKKGRVQGGSASMDDMIPEGLGGSPHPHSVHTPSPTPSDILRPEVNADSHRSAWESLAYSFGFLAPEPPADQVVGDTPVVNGSTQPENDECNENKDSGALCNSETEPSDNSLPPEPQPIQNGTSEPESESEPQKSVESSDSGCEKDESEKDFSSNDNAETTPTPSPTDPSPVRSLTILAPSALNSSVVNGALPPEPLDSNSVSEAFNEPTPTQPPPPPVREGLTVLSPAALGATSGSVNLLNLNPNNASNDPLGLLRNYIEPETSSYMLQTCEVCGDRSDNLAQHQAAMGHYKCHMSPDCAVVLFTSAAELSKHQHVTHGIAPQQSHVTHGIAPQQSPQQSLEQLAQQVQRLPVPYGMAPSMGTPPPSGSPLSYRVPGGITLSYPTPPAPGPANTPPFQGGIQARPFAMQTSPSTIRPDGSPAASPTLPPGLSRSISISPSVKPAQKRSTSSPVVEPAKRRYTKHRPDSPDCELVDVQQPVPTLPRSISLISLNSSDANPPARKESSGVANILASRGITVTPAVNKTPTAPPPSPRSPAQPVPTISLNSAVTIVPASQARSQFAVPQPQGRSVGRPVDRNIRPPTVDLTQDSPPVFRRNRQQRFTCQVCDKVFTTQETLNQHLTSHRSPGGKLPYKCNLCNAQYPTQQGMLQHKQTYHKEAQGSEMALPVVDIKHPGTIQKLTSLGIRHCLVLSQLGNSSGGMFGLPIVAIDNARNPAVCNLAALGASNVLSLGPAKALR